MVTSPAEAGGGKMKENDKNSHRKHSTGRKSTRQTEEHLCSLFFQLRQLNKACSGSVLAFVLWPRCQVGSPVLGDV